MNFSGGLAWTLASGGAEVARCCVLDFAVVPVFFFLIQFPGIRNGIREI